MKKRISLLALVISLAFSLLPTSVFAVEEEDLSGVPTAEESELDGGTSIVDESSSDGEVDESDSSLDEDAITPTSFEFSAVNKWDETVALSISEESGSYVLRVPDSAITQTDSCKLVVTAKEELKDNFSIGYCKYLSTTIITKDQQVDSVDGVATVQKWYALGGRKIADRIYNKEIILTYGDQSYTIKIIPYCSVEKIGVFDTDHLIEWPVTQDADGIYHASAVRGTTVAVRVSGYKFSKKVHRVVSFDGEENNAYYLSKSYSIDQETASDITFKVEIKDQADVASGFEDYTIEDGEYTLILHVIDEQLYPIIKNYNAKTYNISGGAIVNGVTSVTFEQGSTEGTTLTVEVENDTGSMTYEWIDYRTNEVLSTEKTYTVDTSVAGNPTFYCRITNVVDGVSYQNRTARIDVQINAITVDKPEITTQPVSADYKLGKKASALKVAVQLQDGYKYYYQWYRGTVDSATMIEGATSATYTPEVTSVGTDTYYCSVIAEYSGVKSEPQYSDMATITVSKVETGMNGEGTSTDPFQIATAEDLTRLCNLVNTEGYEFEGTYFRMIADITLPEGWVPIGCTKDGSNDIKRGENLNPFSGNFDGGDHTLTVPAGGLPLLGYVKGASVQNLNIYGEKIAGYGLVNNFEGVGLSGSAIVIENVTLKKGTQTLKAGLLGTNITTNGFAGVSATFVATIRNCTVEEGVVIGYSGTESYIGSFAGRLQGTIENCVSYATVQGDKYVGGIVGSRDNAMGTCEIKSCTFHGSVEGSGSYTGGILGGGYWGAAAPNAIRPTIVNCTVDGTVKGNVAVGGITGGDVAVAQAWNSYDLSDNSFTGKVSGKQYVGAIIGYYDSLNKMDNITGNTYSAGCGSDVGIAYVKYIDTSVSDPTLLTDSIAFNTANGVTDCPTVAGCAWKANHNRTDDPLGKDADALCKMIRSQGDLNGDGQITNADAAQLLAIVTAGENEDLSVADLNGDGLITNADVAQLLQMVTAA